MGNDIRLSVTGDTQGLVDAVKKGAVAVEKLEEVLDDTGTAGKTSGRDIERSMEDAQKNTKRLEDEIKDARDAFEKAGRAGRDLGDNVYKGTDRAKAGFAELGQEARQNAAETFSSFDGSAQSFADGIQGTFGGVVSSLGPVGAAAGAAGAIGLGLITAELQRQQEETNKLKERFSELYSSAVADGRAYLDEAQIVAAAQDIILNPDNAQKWKDIQKQAVEIGLDASLLARAQAGDQDALNAVIDRTKALYGDAAKTVEDSTGIYDQSGDKQLSSLGKIQDEYLTLAGIQDDNKQKAKDAIAIADDSERRSGVANIKQLERYNSEAAAAQRVADKVNGIPDKTVNVKLNFGTAEADLERFTGKAREVRLMAQITDPRTGRRVPG